MVFVNRCAKLLLLAESVRGARIILLMKMVFVCFAARYSMIVQCVMKTHAFRAAHKNAGPALVKLTRIVLYVLTAIIYKMIRVWPARLIHRSVYVGKNKYNNVQDAMSQGKFVIFVSKTIPYMTTNVYKKIVD